MKVFLADLRVSLRELVFGYIFWALFQALAPMIWFYPLNELEISGYEAFVILLYSPLLLGITPFYKQCSTQWGLAVLRMLSVASLASFQLGTTLMRLMVLAGGCFCVMLVFTVSLWADQEYRTRTFWGHFHGLIAFIVSRIWFTSFVPVWWNATSNSVVITIGVIATMDKVFYGHHIKSEPSKKESESTKQKKDISDPPPSWLLTAVGYGSLLFLIQWVFGEVSIVSRWTVKGYPETGPMPYPSGLAVLLGLWLGVELSPCRHVTRSVVWWLLGSCSFCALYYLTGYWAFTGGVLLAVYTMSVFPEMTDRLTACPPARTLGLALVVWTIETLFSVWTVAYNFVPGGVYTREHSDWLLAFIMLSIGAAMFIKKPKMTSQSKTAFTTVRGNKMPSSHIKTVFFVLLLLGAGGFVYRYPRQLPSHPTYDQQQQQDNISAAIWTFHFGYDNKGWPSLERAAWLLQHTGADVITLLESDASKPFLGNNDLGMWLGERLGMYVDFGPSTRDHTWGNLILSKYPFVKSTHHLLPSPEGELSPAVTATINITGQLVDFVVTHMGNDQDVLDRKLQAEVLASELKQAENPVVFLGYVTSAPGSRDYKKLIDHGHMNDIDDTDTDRWCEYILYRGLIRQGYARLSHGGLSDTEVQIAKFMLPQDRLSFRDNDRIVTDPNKVDPRVRFSAKFGGFKHGHNWKEVQRYHMSTPKYFVKS